ncbi:YceH family protein [Granulicella sibirica]|uniref:Uncharacterized protein n=1 Tax=Granulicella sibirica TaxID=2479048 RepID=A0A4Q0T4N3_9BACT|nr:YceH family protein [Granulicella sibirica]RXH58623.1 Protein of unknown function YceH [Granulicella sibirica]
MTDSTQSPLGAPLGLIELRVLGSLIEKEITTPEQYPLSLNALLNACNQRSSREPVLDLTQHQVFDAINVLEDLDLVNPIRDARVAKYEHRIRTILNLRRDETALICLLLLRGPQTPGELRSRADRMYAFDDLAAVQSTLDRLANRPLTGEGAAPKHPGPLTLQLPRQPGARESRYTHLLGDPTSIPVSAPQADTPRPSPNRIDQMERDLLELREQVAALSARLEALESTE